MKITDVAVQLAPAGQDRLRGFLLHHDRWQFCGTGYQGDQRAQCRAVCGDAFPQDHGQLPRLPDEESPPCPFLQSVRHAVAGDGAGGGAGQDALRRGAPDQCGVPADD